MKLIKRIMGSITGKINDDYEMYLDMCEITNRKPQPIARFLSKQSFYDDMQEMFIEAGVTNEHDWFLKMFDDE